MEVVRELLDKGAAIDAATKKGNTALHIASLAGQETVVKLLVQNGAQVSGEFLFCHFINSHFTKEGNVFIYSCS